MYQSFAKIRHLMCMISVRFKQYENIDLENFNFIEL